MSTTSTTPRKKQSIITLLVSDRFKETATKFDALCASLDINRNALVFYLMDQALKTPPKIEDLPRDVAKRTSTGGSPGFWLDHLRDESGRFIGVTLTEVLTRGSMQGRSFYKYTKGNADARGRAMAQATAAAEWDVRGLGLESYDFTCLEGDQLKAALTARPIKAAKADGVDDAASTKPAPAVEKETKGKAPAPATKKAKK